MSWQILCQAIDLVDCRYTNLKVRCGTAWSRNNGKLSFLWRRGIESTGFYAVQIAQKIVGVGSAFFQRGRNSSCFGAFQTA